ncbi:DUF5400 family protein [Methanospirillum lacunae]|uniref:Uncharacterized protein n=1 Tax=Methanospirillum lacunae TaxID=668570 RepID=A0A2V2N6V9_9EURY|nr:DUF5400 family protein [Methanospirillum lacunae]PWR74235.1 hypothetical protein DK846_03540 [Methanospirillum lacunae]
MEQIYFVLTLAVMISSIVTGFIVFRMQGMGLAPHFGMLIIAMLATLAAIISGNSGVYYLAAVLQFLAVITAYTQMFKILKYNFQTAPAYAPHIALVTLLPTLVIAGIIL